MRSERTIWSLAPSLSARSRRGQSVAGRLGLLALWLAAALAGCDGRRGNFSQHPGFSAYFAAYPPGSAAATVEEQGLLRRHRPHLMLPHGQGGPIDFYADYVAHGALTDGAGRLVTTRVPPEVLNAHKDDPGAVFVHRPGRRPTTPTVYGRVDRETVAFPTAAGVVSEPFTFLTYHAVFPLSGLPGGLPGWQAALLSLVASVEDWHQLDHYTAATMALNRDLVPVAITLQQHNHLRTYLLGDDLLLPPDGRVRIDVAVRSNELYPHVPGRTRRRAVSMPDPAAVRYLMTGTRPPLLSADDVTESVAEAEYALAFLPPDDAFYRFQGYLGERRWPRSREGPPGADYNTLPGLKPRGAQMLAFYWRDGDPGDVARFDRAVESGGVLTAFARAQAPVFHRRWQCVRERGPDGGGSPCPS